MLDIGTRPGFRSIVKLYKFMLNNDNCGGCCGEIEVAMSNDEGSAFLKYA